MNKLSYPAVETLLPHRPPMLLVERILDVTEKTGLAQAQVLANHLFLRQDGTLSPEVYCELVAQGFGVCESWRRVQKGLTIDGGGFLASLRDVEFLAPAHAGDVLTVRTEKTEECFDTHIVFGEVFCKDKKLAQATIYIYMWKNEEPSVAL
jgi:predicted hotdog family 3-hydroxylacyl-ACP dehydratase